MTVVPIVWHCHYHVKLLLSRGMTLHLTRGNFWEKYF